MDTSHIEPHTHMDAQCSNPYGQQQHYYMSPYQSAGPAPPMRLSVNTDEPFQNGVGGRVPNASGGNQQQSNTANKQANGKSHSRRAAKDKEMSHMAATATTTVKAPAIATPTSECDDAQTAENTDCDKQMTSGCLTSSPEAEQPISFREVEVFELES